MTPASVDGGPDKCKMIVAWESDRHCGGDAIGHMGDVPICARCLISALNDDPALATTEAIVLNRHRRPTTARDAALREEGRVQGLRDGLGRALLVLAVRREVMRENGILSDRDVETLGKLANELANEFANDLTQPPPDASQGSAPALAFPEKFADKVTAILAAAPQGSPLPGKL